MINFSDRLKKLKERRQGTAQRYALDQGYTAFMYRTLSGKRINNTV